MAIGDPFADHAVANMIALSLGGLAAITLLLWFVFLSGYGKRLRVATAIVCLVVAGALAALFRVDRVSGELLPAFAFRFSPKPDQRLTTPWPDGLASAPRPTVDLRTTGPWDFPEFLGPGRCVAASGVRLARDWQRRPPRLLWRQPIGAGWSAFSVVNGSAVTMEQRGDQEMVTCYALRTGKLQWAHAIQTRYEGVSGGVGPRATPTIHEGLVFALGATGHLVCLDGSTGRCRWRKNLLEQYGITPDVETACLPWGRSASPLIVDDLVIVPVGGLKRGRRVALAAYDTRQGRLVWESGEEQVSYSSPTLATLAGVRQVLIVNEQSASGHDPQTGRLLWQHPWPGRSNANPNVSQAVPVPPDRVFLSKGYGQGAILIQLYHQEPAHLTPKIVWKNPKVMRTKFTNVALRDGYAFGLSDGILECIDLGTGQRVWKSGRYYHGQVLRVEDLLLVLTESGEVVLVEASAERPNHVLGRFQAIRGMTWNNLALSGPCLLVRNAEEAACYELPLEP